MRLIVMVCLLAAVVPLMSTCAVPGSINANTNTGPVRAAANSDTARTNIEELTLLVKVPYPTEDAVWKEYAGEKRVVAVLRFSPQDANTLVAEAARSGAAVPATLEVEPWFPNELIAEAEASGDNSLKGSAYPATAFLQEPYSAGRLTRIEGTDFFVLEVRER